MNNKSTEKKAAKKAVRKEERQLMKAKSNQHAQMNKQAGKYIGPYLLAILDPEGHGIGAKIPDAVTIGSQPYTGRQKDQQASGLVGTGLAWIIALGCTPNASFQRGTVATNGTITWSGTWIVASWAAQLIANTQLIRIVSGIARLQVQGSQNNNQGRLIAAFYPNAGVTRSNALTLPPPNSAAVENSTFAVSKNVASGGNAIEVRYIPADSVSNGYVQTSSGTTPSGFVPGYFVLIADGLAAGVNCEIYDQENLEVVALNASASIMSATPSKSDPLEMAATTNFLSEKPLASVAQSSAVKSGSPIPLQLPISAVQPHVNEPTLLEKVISGADSVMSSAKKYAPAAASLLALL